MSYYNWLLVSYVAILTFGYFITFLLYYAFGWFYDKRLRLVMKRVQLSRLQSFFLHFRGVPRDELNIHSAVCVYFEIFSLVALFGFEGASLLLVKFLNLSLITACRMSLAFMAVAFVAWLIIITIVSVEFRKRINVIRDEGRVDFKTYKELDSIFLGKENLSAWAPEKAKTVQLEPNVPLWQQYVIDFESLTKLEEGKKSVKAATPTGSFYHPVVQNENIDNLDKGKSSLNEMNLLNDEPIIPFNVNGSEEIDDLNTGKRELKTKNFFEDDIFMSIIPVDVKEFGTVEPEESFEDAIDITEGKEALKKMLQDQLNSEFISPNLFDENDSL